MTSDEGNVKHQIFAVTSNFVDEAEMQDRAEIKRKKAERAEEEHFDNFQIVISHAKDIGRFALLAAPTGTEKAVTPPHKKIKRKHPPCSSSIIWTEVSSASDSD